MARDLLSKIEKIHNQLSDMNVIWFPFLWLKLKPEQILTTKHIIKMTFWFSLYFNLGYLFKKVLFGEQLTMRGAVYAQLLLGVLFFIWFQTVTKKFWNQRANRLLDEKNSDVSPT